MLFTKNTITEIASKKSYNWFKLYLRLNVHSNITFTNFIKKSPVIYSCLVRERKTYGYLSPIIKVSRHTVVPVSP